MSGQHKHSPLRFRPPGPEREWLEARKAETGEPMNAILTLAVRALMARDRILAAHPITTKVIPPGYRAGTGEKFGCETCHDWDGVTEGRGYCETLLALGADEQ